MRFGAQSRSATAGVHQTFVSWTDGRGMTEPAHHTLASKHGVDEELRYGKVRP